MNIRWLQPWTPLDNSERRRTLERELQREVSAGHPLHGRSAVALARRSDADDVLFLLQDGSVAEVHLTWRGQREDDPRWPATEIFASLAAWSDQRMKPRPEDRIKKGTSS